MRDRRRARCAATIERVLRHPVELTCAGPHRRRRARLGPGRHLRRDAEPSARPRGAPSLGQQAVRPGDRGARRSSWRRRRLRRPLLGHVPPLPLHGPEPAVPDPFLPRTAWHVPTPLDLRRCGSPATRFIGEHDFSSFCRRPRWPTSRRADVARPPGASTPRWDDLGDDVLRFEIKANAFCHQMVRSDRGHAGRGRPGSQARRATSRRSSRARDRARRRAGWRPPHGLCLWQVDYPEPVPGWDLPPAPDFIECPSGLPEPSRLASEPLAPRVVGSVAHRPERRPAREGRRVRTYTPRPARSSATGTSSTPRPRPRPPVHRGRPHPPGQAQADLRPAPRHRRPRDHHQRRQGRAHRRQGRAKRSTATRGYPGGLKRETYAEPPGPEARGGRSPQSIRGMLPKNRLGRQLLTKLKVYAGPEHPHAAQQPEGPRARPTPRRGSDEA